MRACCACRSSVFGSRRNRDGQHGTSIKWDERFRFRPLKPTIPIAARTPATAAMVCRLRTTGVVKCLLLLCILPFLEASAGGRESQRMRLRCEDSSMAQSGSREASGVVLRAMQVFSCAHSDFSPGILLQAEILKLPGGLPGRPPVCFLHVSRQHQPCFHHIALFFSYVE